MWRIVSVNWVRQPGYSLADKVLQRFPFRLPPDCLKKWQCRFDLQVNHFYSFPDRLYTYRFLDPSNFCAEASAFFDFLWLRRFCRRLTFNCMVAISLMHNIIPCLYPILEANSLFFHGQDLFPLRNKEKGNKG